jgi:DEAD/DEAH box helicase
MGITTHLALRSSALKTHAGKSLEWWGGNDAAPYLTVCNMTPPHTLRDASDIVLRPLALKRSVPVCPPITTSPHTPNKHQQPYLQSGDGPIVLVLAPTRELALQIKQECDKFGASSEIKNTVVYGGVPKSSQVRDLR